MEIKKKLFDHPYELLNYFQIFITQQELTNFSCYQEIKKNAYSPIAVAIVDYKKLTFSKKN